MKSKLSGVIVAILLAFAAKSLSGFTPWLGSASLAIILGILLASITRFRSFLSIGSKWTEKNVLQWAVALLGLQISFASISEVGGLFLGLVAITIIILVSAFWLLPILKIKGTTDLFWLLGSGEAVCGSAAIASVSGSINSKSESIAASVLVINIFSTIGLIIIPIILTALKVDGLQSAWWTGGYLQSAGHAIAAGFTMGDESGTMATTLKMSRVALLLPLIFVSQMIFKKKDEANPNRKTKANLPGFLWAFVAFVIVSNSIDFPAEILSFTTKATHYLLLTALAAIGLNIRLNTLRQSGKSALLAGSVLTGIHLLTMFILWILWKSF